MDHQPLTNDDLRIRSSGVDAHSNPYDYVYDDNGNTVSADFFDESGKHLIQEFDRSVSNRLTISVFNGSDHTLINRIRYKPGLDGVLGTNDDEVEQQTGEFRGTDTSGHAYRYVYDGNGNLELADFYDDASQHLEQAFDRATAGRLKVSLYNADRKSTRLNSSHSDRSRMPSSA